MDGGAGNGPNPAFGDFGEFFLFRRSKFADALFSGPVQQGGRAILEVDEEFAGFQLKRADFGQDKASLFAGLGFDVAVFAFSGVGQAKVDPAGVGAGVRLEAEGIIAQIFAGFDVVLVVVGPVEFDFFTVVGDGISAVA